MSRTVALIADNHFIYTESNEVYVNGTYTKQYLTRFTSNFDRLIVIARGRKMCDSDNLEKLRLSGGDKVEFCFLSDFKGIMGFVKKRRTLKRQISDCLKNVDAIFVRMPCILTTISISTAKSVHIPILIDVGADPETIYEGATNGLIVRILSRYLGSICRKACLMANGVSYVTNHILQNKYPCKSILAGESVEYFTAAISNVDISSDFYCKRSIRRDINRIKLLHISNNIPTSSSKGHQEALEICQQLNSEGYDFEMTFLGDGEGIDILIEQAKKLGISERVIFKGRIADRNTYRNILLDNDIFLFPSHSEGLPRVLIEAMATGMVCVSSNVDGIPELLVEEDIFDYADIKGMSERIIKLINDPEEMKTASIRNYNRSLDYSHEKMKSKIDIYYGKVRILIDNWHYSKQ